MGFRSSDGTKENNMVNVLLWVMDWPQKAQCFYEINY